MINDLVDLDHVLDQYDPGKVLVGPPLNLSINSNFRFFYVAGNGGKIFHSIGLGFIDAEPEAERQRGDIIAKLQSRFIEVKVLSNQLEMAAEANALWSNEETVRFLATATLEAKLQPEIARHDDGQDYSETGALEALTESVILAASADTTLSSPDVLSPGSEPYSSAPSGTSNLPNAYATWPLNVDSAVAPISRHAALDQDDLALAVLRLKSPEAGTDTGTTETTVANAETITHQTVVDGGRSVPTVYRFVAFGGVAALIAGIVVLASTQQVEEEALAILSTMRVISADHNSDHSNTTGSLPLSNPRDRAADANRPALQAPEVARAPELAPQFGPSSAAIAQNDAVSQRPQIAAPFVSQSPATQKASAQIDGAPISTSQSSPSQVLETKAASSPQEPSQRRSEAATAVHAPAARAVDASQGQARVVPDAVLQLQTADTDVAAVAVLNPESQQAINRQATPPSASKMTQPQALDAPASSSRVQTAPASGQAAPTPAEPSTNAPTNAIHAQTGDAAVVSEPQTSPSHMASAERGTPGVATPERSTAKAAGVAQPLGADELDALLSRSTDFIKSGDFSAARILLRRAAESGSADAALLLGKTFDPLYLKELGAIGIAADIAQARHWYQKAVELGSDAAAQRLANLAQSGDQP